MTGRGLVPGSESISGAASVEASDSDGRSSVPSARSSSRSWESRSACSSPRRLDSTTTAPSAQNFTSRPIPGERLVAGVETSRSFGSTVLSTLRVRGAHSASPGSNPAPPTCAAVLHAGRGQEGRGEGLRREFGEPGQSRPEARAVPRRSSWESTLHPLRRQAGDRGHLFDHKLTKDVLVLRNIAPSLGASDAQFFNLGRIRNRGFEPRPGHPAHRQAQHVIWDLYRERIGEQQQDPRSRRRRAADRVLGFYQRHCHGYLAGGFWGARVSFDDADGNGIIVASEVTVGDTLEFLGDALPTREASLSISPHPVYNGRVRLGNQFR